MVVGEDVAIAETIVTSHQLDQHNQDQVHRYNRIVLMIWNFKDILISITLINKMIDN